MPIVHTVVFRLVHDPDSTGERAFLDRALRVLAPLPGVQDFTVRRQISPKSGMTWQFSMRFADRVAYEEYDAHPAHRDFVETAWVDEVAEFQEYDFDE